MHKARGTCALDTKSNAYKVLIIIAVGEGRQMSETYHIFHEAKGLGTSNKKNVDEAKLTQISTGCQ